MSSLTKGLILLLVILGVGAGLVFWKNKVGGHSTASMNSITNEEIDILLADVAKNNPMALKRLAEQPELKKEQLESLKELLAFASEAQREGVADEKNNRAELENIKSEVVAINYDREMNKDKGPMPPFGFITEERIKQFWGEGEQPPTSWWQSFKNKIGLGRRDNELAFEKFLETKLAIMAAGNPKMKDRQITPEERQQARDFFAKIAIYNQEYEDKVASGEIPKEVQQKIDLQIKLQQAQFLMKLYATKMAESLKVTDEDVAKYIAEHPELGGADKRAKAQDILNRAKAGEDFAALANEFSEDPGNKNEKGEAQGGLYEKVVKGKMVPAFETAALALEPGQISAELVETDYGYHIIKLEKKGVSNDPATQGQETYDARHILIMTGVKDPENPLGGEKPVKVFVREKLESEKQKAALAAIILRNRISVPDDFNVPAVSDEQIQEMMKKQQMQQGMDFDPEGPPPPEVKKEVKKAKAKNAK